MVNHLRTLLINRNGPVIPNGTIPGEEYIPPYRAVILPSYLQALRIRLFGANPDWPMLRYRMRQFLPIVHATPLEEYVFALDRRITYDLDATDFVSNTIFQPVVNQISGTAEDILTVLGTPTAPDISGRIYQSYSIVPTGSGTVAVQTLQPPIQQQEIPFAPGDLITLPGAGYTFRLTTDNPGASWLVEITNRPSVDPGVIVASVAVSGETNFLQLFGAAPVEPYLTFSNLWSTQKISTLRLAALLLAIGYRTEERRVTGA